MTEIVLGITILSAAIVSGCLVWLFADALRARFEMKTFLRMLGFGFFGGIFALKIINLGFTQGSLTFDLSNFETWVASIAFWAFFVSFALDDHFKLQWSFLLIIGGVIFLRGHSLLTLQTSLIFASVLQLAYTTKHRDMIPLGVGFILMAIGEFFLALSGTGEDLELAASFMYLFAQVAFILWWWSYVSIRFSIKKLGPRLQV